MLGTDAEQVLTKVYMTLGRDPSEGPLIRAAGWRAVWMVIVSFAASRLFRLIDSAADSDSPLCQPFVRRVE